MNSPLSTPPAVTAFESDLLVAASLSTVPQTAYQLTGVTVGGPRRDRRLTAYIRAGFLIEHREGRHPTYTITPAGREFAEYLSRLEAAREAQDS